MNRFFLISCSILTAFSVSAQTVSTHVFKVIQGKQLQLDIYQPSGTKSNVPAVILFHGGGLVKGNKEQMKNQCMFFAERGITAVTANYRLLPKGTPEARSQVVQCIKDAKSAVRWVKEHASEFNIDTALIILGGGSAGGFLASEAALNDDINEETDNLHISTKAEALILYNPAYTPETRYAPPPAQFISKTSSPAVLFYGDKDKFKPGGDYFFNKLQKEKIPSELWIAPGETHSFFNKPGWNEAVNKKAYNFLISTKLIRGKYEKEVPGFILIPQKTSTN